MFNLWNLDCTWFDTNPQSDLVTTNTVIIYLYLYIYIFINFLTKSTYGDRQKEKTLPEFGDKNISRITVRGKKKKKSYRGKKKEKANLVTPIEKNQEIRNRLVKRKKKAL